MRKLSLTNFGKLLLIVTLLCSWTVFLIPQTAKVKALLAEADKLHEARDYEGTMAKLREAEKIENKNPEVLWKIARAYFDFADQQPDNKEVQQANLYPGFDYAKK
ncbi:MAG: hypothetical protein PHC43_02530, partial [Candidatus Marinimicrobia bacterium]|nr:hypothetical protein [Candidatus Neomarinimicrobiota bacterium]